MPIISIALMGFFAFSGAPQASASATSTAVIEASASSAVASDSYVRLSGADPLTVLLTGYNAVPEQTDANPQVTASGAASNAEVVIARSVDLAQDLPYGTVVAVEYSGKDTEGCRFGKVSGLIGYRVVADAMNSRKRGQMDVLFGTDDTVEVHGKDMNPAVALGLCKDVTIRPIGRLKVSEIPATQEALRKLVEGDALAFK